MRRIHKVAAAVIQDNEFLMVRKVGKDIWTSLGGKIEKGETEQQCLLREIREEIDCGAKIVRKLGDFEDKAVFHDANIFLSVYLTELEGKINLRDPELEECRFLGKDYAQKGVKLPEIIEKQLIPKMVNDGLLNW